MPLKVQNWPKGLYEICQVVGQEPLTLDNDIRGVIDLTRILGASRTEVGQIASGTISGTGQALFLEVPDGETWFVYGVAATLVAAAVGDGLAVQAKFNPASGGSTPLAQSPQVVTVDANESVKAIYNPASTFVANAGDRFSLRVEAFALASGTNRAASLDVWYSQFRT